MFSFFTGNPQVIKGKINALQGQLDVLEASVHQQTRHSVRLETQIGELREEISAYKAALHKLSGQVHGPKSQIDRPPMRQQQATQDNAQRRAALRARVGIVAGQPYAHAATPTNEDEDA